MIDLNGMEKRGYDWKDGGPTSAHEYILPTLVRLIRGIAQGKALRIVDIGCGNGYIAGHLALEGHKVVGIDSAPEGIVNAKTSYPGAVFHECSVYAHDLPELLGNDNDCVIAIELVEHLFFPSHLFEQAYVILKPAGRLIVSTPYHGYLKNLGISLCNGWDRHFKVEWEGGHIKFFSWRTIERLGRTSGFRNCRFYGVGRVPLLWKSMIMTFEK